MTLQILCPKFFKSPDGKKWKKRIQKSMDKAITDTIHEMLNKKPIEKTCLIGAAPSESLFGQALALENIQAGDRVDIIMDEKGHFKLRRAIVK